MFEQMVAVTIPVVADLRGYLSAVYGVVECHKGGLDTGRHFPDSEEAAALEQGGVEMRFESLRSYVEAVTNCD